MTGNVIVTGGAGYIGSHACKALAASGFSPVTYDNLSIGNRWAVKWGPLELGDILDTGRLDEVFKAHRPVAVMHFAALAQVGESVSEPSLYYRTNVTGALNLLDACRAHGVPVFVFSSSCAVYGSPDKLPITEDAPKAPISPYGASKLMVERILADFEISNGLRYMGLRYFNAAGADPDGEIGECRNVETHLIPLVLDAIEGSRPPVKVLGNDYPTPDGTAIRDYIQVTDLAETHVRALELLMTGGPSKILNLGTGRGYSVREVIDTAIEITGRPVPHENAPRRLGDPAQLVADSSAARALLGDSITQRSSLDHIVETAWRWQSSDAYARARVVS